MNYFRMLRKDFLAPIMFLDYLVIFSQFSERQRRQKGWSDQDQNHMV